MVAILDHHLGFYSKREIMKRRKLKVFDARHVEYDIIKRFAIFVDMFCFFSQQKGEKRILFTNGLTTYYL